MLKKLLTSSLIAVIAVMLAGTGTAVADREDRGVTVKRNAVPFLIKLMGGDPDNLIAKNGDLRVFARCIDFSEPTEHRLDIVVTSTKEFAGDDSFGKLNPPDTEIILFSIQERDLSFENGRNLGTFAQDGTHYVGIDGESTSLGVNIFGYDCFTAGTAMIILVKKRRSRSRRDGDDDDDDDDDD